MFLSQIDFQRKSSAKGWLVKDGKTRPNYDTFPSKEVEGRLVGRQDIGASTAATCFSSKKEARGTKTRDVWSAQSAEAVEREKPPKRFLSSGAFRFFASICCLANACLRRPIYAFGPLLRLTRLKYFNATQYEWQLFFVALDMWVSSTFERLDDWIILDTLWHVETNRMTISMSSPMTEVIQLIVIDWGFSAKSVLGCKVFIQKGPNALLQ